MGDTSDGTTSDPIKGETYVTVSNEEKQSIPADTESEPQSELNAGVCQADESDIKLISETRGQEEANKENNPPASCAEDLIADNDLHNHTSEPVSACHNEKLKQALTDSVENLMKFAEILYKCTLCTTLPSILTSRDSFISHVSDKHLTAQGFYKECPQCLIRFRTDGDLKAHTSCMHPGSDFIKANSEEESENSTSDWSDSKGDGSLESTNEKIRVSKMDIGKKNIVEKKESLKSDAGSEKNDSLKVGHSDHKENKTTPVIPKVQKVSPSSPKNIPLLQLKEQIVKCNIPKPVHPPPPTPIATYPSSASFTPEFGKFTKLVREGGNIVYFCQVCNWKSPVKSNFHSHCTSLDHKNKVKCAQDKEGDQKDQDADKVPFAPHGFLTGFSTNASTSSSIHLTRDKREFKEPVSWMPRGGASCLSILSESGGFYRGNRRGASSPERPIVLPLEVQNLTRERNVLASCKDSFDFRKFGLQSKESSEEKSLDLRVNKRKRPASTALRNQMALKQSWSDSDSDDSVEVDRQNTDSQEMEHKFMQSFRKKSKLKLLHRRYRSTKRASPNKKPWFDDHYLKGDNQWDMNFETSKQENERKRCNSNTEVSHECNTSKSGKDNPAMSVSNLTSPHSQKMISPYRPWLKETLYESESHVSGNQSDKIKKEEAVGEQNCPDKHETILFDQDKKKSCFEEQKCNTVIPSKSPLETSVNNGAENVYKCCFCDFQYNGIQQYQQHFEEKHCMGGGGGDGELGGTMEGDSADFPVLEMGENWRVQKLKEILPDLVCVCPKGNVSRDHLLQKISIMLGKPGAIAWGPACNRAMREVFPDSMAQRKGKFKKYFFGVNLTTEIQQEPVEDLSDSENLSYQPLRDMTADIEKILEHLPGLICWSGDMTRGVSRDEVLELLEDRISDSDVRMWSTQCNRAVRMIYPAVEMKRKGKYKTTVFFGVEFLNNTHKQTFIPNKRGRPRKVLQNDDVQYNLMVMPHDQDQIHTNFELQSLERKGLLKMARAKNWLDSIGYNHDDMEQAEPSGLTTTGAESGDSSSHFMDTNMNFNNYMMRIPGLWDKSPAFNWYGQATNGHTSFDRDSSRFLEPRDYSLNSRNGPSYEADGENSTEIDHLTETRSENDENKSQNMFSCIKREPELDPESDSVRSAESGCNMYLQGVGSSDEWTSQPDDENSLKLVLKNVKPDVT